MPGQFISPEGDLELIFVDDYNLIDQYAATGSLWLWGWNAYGELGDNSSTNKSSPVQTVAGGTNWKQITSTGVSSAGIKTDGTLWLWGDNPYGQLGDNTRTDKSSPVQTISGGSNWKQVDGSMTPSTTGKEHVAAIKTDGTLWGWGSNNVGQLGTNDITNYSSPVQTVSGGTNWKLVSCGTYGAAAIKTDGTLWTWGYNLYGQLGDNTTTYKSSPVQTVSGGTNWKSLSFGNYYIAAIKTDGTLWTWGYNFYGTLGDNTSGTGTNKSSPVQTVAGGTNWKQVSCGYFHTAAIKTNGTLWLWGNNTYGQLGDNTRTNTQSPIQTVSGGTNWKQVSSGLRFTAAIKTDGTLWTWGRNFRGNLGDNSITNYSSPIQTVAGGTNWKQIETGNYMTGGIHFYDANNQYPNA